MSKARPAPTPSIRAFSRSRAALSRGFGIEVGGPAIEHAREPHEASPRSREGTGPRQLAELVTQLPVLGGGAPQRERVLIRHALVFVRERLNKRKILGD